MNNIKTAGPVPQAALHNALQKEQDRQKMGERGSDEVLLDEEGIALDDLSHQISAIAAENASKPVLKIQFQSSNNPTRKGWRRSRANTAAPPHTDSMDVLAMGRLYERLGKLSVIPRWFLYIAPLTILIAVPLVLGAIMTNLELGVRLHKMD
jgi:hypothetical protein